MKMKKRWLFLGLFLGLMVGAYYTIRTTKNEKKVLKVLEWNIWHEGHSKKYGQKGCDGVIGILKESKADVILMIETYGAANKVADSLGFYHRLISSNLSVYSRYPIVQTYLFSSIPSFNFGGVMINVNGQKVRVFDTWLHYLPDASAIPDSLTTNKQLLKWENAGSRDDEINKIMKELQPFIVEANEIPIIMGGDFNGHSHLDWMEETKNLYGHNGRTANWTISNVMMANGFVDSYREIHPSAAKESGVTWLYGHSKDETTNKENHRIDYIYKNGAGIRTLASESYDQVLGESLHFKEKNFFYSSDHGFVLSTFEIR